MNKKKKAKWDAADAAAKEAIRAFDRHAVNEGLVDVDPDDYPRQENKQARRFIVCIIDRLSCKGFHQDLLESHKALKTYRNIW